MISRKYKIIYDLANCVMIYLLGLALAIGATALKKIPNFPWAFAIAAAIILVGCVAMRLLIGPFVVSLIGHAVILAVVWFAFVKGKTENDLFMGVLILAFAALLSAIDLFADFYKKKNQSYGEIHVFACLVFLPVYAYVDWKQKALALEDGRMSAICGIYGTLICVICILFFGCTLVRAYMKNAIKLADNSQMDENAPVTYMYGNSNKFIGPIIAFIIAIMLVIQSKTSSNIFATIWMGLLQGVAGICNLFSFLRSSDEVISGGTTIAPAGTTLYWVEVIISAIIVLAIVIAIAVIISKIYKSHWHKDASLDETLESAAMVEKREWIYHKASKKVSDDTSVSKAKEINVEKVEDNAAPAEAEAPAEEVAETVEEAAPVEEVVEAVEAAPVEEVVEAVEAAPVEEVVEAVEEAPVEEVAEAVEAAPVEEVVEAVEAAPVEEVAEAVEEKAEEVAEAAAEKTEEVAEAVEEKAEAVKAKPNKKPEAKKPSSNSKSKKRK